MTVIEKVRTSESVEADAPAFEFMAVWSEAGQDAGLRTIPASRMKTAREHRVPLRGRALEILEAVR